ncbi:MAG: CDP-paratose 2-epimerase, partial [Solirubrobacteraceae bacterium]|nr:CDP-paratose 2-epimerase [Solirubrobacteraceae bacterium]
MSTSGQRVLVTGGAGFIGAGLSVALAERHPGWEIVALDSLVRRGSELNLARLRDAGVTFVHGDVRVPGDLAACGPIDALVECSAEPSVLAGSDGSTAFAVHTNILGAYHCLELARAHGAHVVFLSTSRVYPTARLRALAVEEADTRFELAAEQPPGASAAGIAEDMPLDGPRTLYGTTKLAAELLIAEYREMFGLSAVVDRCGVVAGPWQMGRLDQGVFTWWLLAHHFERELAYIGFGGSGKQVRDLLHVADLVDLVERQLVDREAWDGQVVNVGGGREGSLSLLEASALCAELTGREPRWRTEPVERPGDIPVYLSDCSRLYGLTDWRARRTPRETLADT